MKLLLVLFLFYSSPYVLAEEKKMARIAFSNGVELKVEVADTILLRQQGLMNRTPASFPKSLGMLFIFQREEILSFWMRDTYIPLSIGFFDRDKKLINIENMAAQTLAAKEQNLISYRSKGPGLYALEVNQGWFKDNKVEPKMTFKILKPKVNSKKSK